METPPPVEELKCYKCKGRNPLDAEKCIWCGTPVNAMQREYSPPPSQELSQPVAPAGNYIQPSREVIHHAPSDRMAGVASTALTLAVLTVVLSPFIGYCAIPLTLASLSLGFMGLASNTRRLQAVSGLVLTVFSIVWGQALASTLIDALSRAFSPYGP